MERIEYNKISAKLKDELGWDKPLKPNERVQFELLSKGKVSKQLSALGSHKYENVQDYRASVRIPPTDTIYDPYKDNGEGREPGGNVEIAGPHTWNSRDQIWEFENIEFTKGNKGTITVSGTEPHRRPIINYLRACNYTRSNRNAIPPRGTGFVFEEIRIADKAREMMRFEKEKSMAVNHILAMATPEAAMACQLLNFAIKESLEENQAQLISMVQNASGLKKYLGQSNDARSPVMYTIKRAVELEFISYEDISRVWSYKDSKKQLAQVTPGSDPYEHLLDYLFNTKIGETHRDFLETQIAKVDATDKAADAKKAVEKITKGKKADEVPVGD